MASKERRKPGERGRPQVIVKILTSMLVGGFAFLFASAVDSGAGAQIILSVGVSVFVGGIALMTQFLIDADKSILGLTNEIVGLRREYRDYAEETEQLIKTELQSINEEFTKINDATELFGLVERSPLRTDAMVELVRNAMTIQHDDPPLVHDFAQSEIARLSATLLRLGQHGDLTYDGEDRDWLLGLTKVCSRSIDATSLTTVDAGGHGFFDGGLWDNDLGRRYLEAQRDAIERGVQIRRILIIDRPDLNDPDALDQIVADQLRAGVQVRVLRPAHSEVHWIADFIVIDNEVVYQSTATTPVDDRRNPVIEHTRIVTDPRQVRDRITRYNRLWAASEEHRPGGRTSPGIPRQPVPTNDTEVSL